MPNNQEPCDLGERREAIARIIDPYAWERHDEFSALLRGEGLSSDPSLAAMQTRSASRRINTVVADSLIKADAIEALRARPTPAVSGERTDISAREMLAREYDRMGLGHEAKRLRINLGCELQAEKAALTVIGRLAYLEAYAVEAAHSTDTQPQALSEERAREVLASTISGNDKARENIRAGVDVGIVSSEALRAMLRFATSPRPIA